MKRILIMLLCVRAVFVALADGLEVDLRNGGFAFIDNKELKVEKDTMTNVFSVTSNGEICITKFVLAGMADFIIKEGGKKLVNEENVKDSYSCKLYFKPYEEYEIFRNGKSWKVKIVQESYDLQLLSDKAIKLNGKEYTLAGDTLFTLADSVVIVNSMKFPAGMASKKLEISLNGNKFYTGKIDGNCIVRNMNLLLSKDNMYVFCCDGQKWQIGTYSESPQQSLPVWAWIMIVIGTLAILFIIYKYVVPLIYNKVKKRKPSKEVLMEALAKRYDDKSDGMIDKLKGESEDALNVFVRELRIEEFKHFSEEAFNYSKDSIIERIMEVLGVTLEQPVTEDVLSEPKEDDTKVEEPKKNPALERIVKAYEDCEEFKNLKDDEVESKIIEIVAKYRNLVGDSKVLNAIMERLQKERIIGFDITSANVNIALEQALANKLVNPKENIISGVYEEIMDMLKDKNNFANIAAILTKKQSEFNGKTQNEQLTKLFAIINPMLKAHKTTVEIIKEWTEKYRNGISGDEYRSAVDNLVTARIEYGKRNSSDKLIRKLGEILESKSENKSESGQVQDSKVVGVDVSVVDIKSRFNEFVGRLNEKLPKEKQLESVADFDGLCKELERVFAVPQPQPDDETPAPNVEIDVNEQIAARLTEAFGTEVSAGEVDNLKELIWKHYFEGELQNTLGRQKAQEQDFDTYVKDLRKALSNGDEVAKIMEKLGIGKVTEIEKEIEKIVKEKEVETIRKSVRLPEGVSLAFDDCTTAEKIVNKVVRQISESERKAKDADEKRQMAETKAQETEDKIKSSLRDSGKTLTGKELDGDGQETAFDMLGRYNAVVSAFIQNQEETIKTVTGERDAANGNLDAANKKIKAQNVEIGQKQSVIEATVKALKGNFDNGVSAIVELVKRGGYLMWCSRDSKKQCDENEERMRKAAEQFAEAASAALKDPGTPKEALNTVQKFLEAQLESNDSILNIILHYYAYSQLWFMTTKDTRDYGLYFNRKAMSEMYDTVSKLLSDFGIQIKLPVLFAEQVTDGEYLDCTGDEFGDIENVCPNSRNYMEYVKLANKKDVIIDVIRAGYRKGGKSVKEAKVIINN